MSRRTHLPGAAELFRSTQHGAAAAEAVQPDKQPDNVATLPNRRQARKGSGRQRHDEKITVYVSAEELLSLESARLTLRREHGLAVDRGRIVRQAIALALTSLDEYGANSPLVQRLLDDDA
ncbi:hypothetical protein [Fodinicola acaciae]|uniref:hypothetical protein n=1 Tax=Fodinicola acaciae TaxID=2681555 RepID=UPI0013D3F453|nr:hypothetical protein [Fodinicola acaciae]